MLVQKQLLNKLKDFGLNTYETKLWTALLSRGVSTAGELSDIANVPRSRSYDVLESLEKKGFIVMKLGKPIKYLAVPPKEVIDRVKKRVVEDAKQQSELLEGIGNSDVLGELTLLYDQGVRLVEPTELSGSIRGRSSIYNHLGMMINNAQQSIVMVTTPTDFVRKVEAIKSALNRAKDRGVKLKILTSLTTETKKAAEQIKKIAEIRHTDSLSSRFCIVDGKEILFMLLDDTKVHASYDTGVWVSTPYFASSLSALFESEWKQASPPGKSA
ncbi:TrmB family transcriptional regulator [Candidatus Woesearchaeota archaeon]|nr:TrmB family transcriptional regulator [Candidatus Woesearchaeota archaeon]